MGFQYLPVFTTRQPQEILPLGAHMAASKGNLADLQLQIEDRGREVLTERDDQGWQVLHQGVTGGHHAVVKFLRRRYQRKDVCWRRIPAENSGAKAWLSQLPGALSEIHGGTEYRTRAVA